MKAVVTGGSGFIGGFIVEELAKEHDTQVVIFDTVAPNFDLKENMTYKEGDIRHYDEVWEVVQGADEVYDVAGVLGTAELMNISARAADTNVKGAINVLEACKRANVKKIFHPTKPNDWLNTYSITKYAAEQFCLMYQQNYNMNISVLKWFNAYGPRQHLYPIRKVLPMFILQALNNKPITIFGDGEQTVDMVHSKDIANIAIYCTRNHGQIGKVLDVGTGLSITVNQLAKSIIELTGSSSTLEHVPMRPGEPLKSNIKADVVSLKNLVDFKFTDFREGMLETIEYYKKIPQEEVKKCFEFYGIK